MSIATILLAAAAALTSSVAPSVESVRPAIENAVKSQLKDPESARFNWPFGFTADKHGRKIKADFWTCGRVNARNSYGGYTGEDWVYIELRGGQITNVDFGDNFIVDMICDKAARKGQLPRNY